MQSPADKRCKRFRAVAKQDFSAEISGLIFMTFAKRPLLQVVCS